MPITRSEIIELVKILTERKQETVFNYNLLFAHCMQEFCSETRFWWRKVTATFNTVNQTSQYDLSSIALTPALTGISFQELTKVYFVQTATSIIPLTPIFDDSAVTAQIEDTGSGGLPSIYTFDFTDYKTLRLNKPNGVYKIRLVGWGFPNPSSDTSDDSVPLVPPAHHRAIVHCMEKYIWRIIYGLQDPKFITAKAQYDDCVLDATMKKRFTTDYQEQFVSSEDAIRST